ncbi:MAG: hypothetical protein Fur0018_01890 [Anaerolineales bacterium]
MKQRYFIDSHKGATFFFILALMAWYRQWENPTAWIYLALHGSYGFLWVLKSRLFPDKQWEQPASVWYGLYIWGGLTLYWVAPWLLTRNAIQAPVWLLGLCVFLYAFGVFVHFASDMQKYVRLQLRPGRLISDGFFGLSRNINYFGELLIYLSFALLPMHWAPLIILVLMITLSWMPYMRKKERSLARYPEFEAYRRRVKKFIPFVW